jgi:hypothetical protein
VSTLRAHREDILKALTLSLDSCIECSEEFDDIRGTESKAFEAELTFTFQGHTRTVKARPALDLTQPVEPQLTRHARFVNEKTGQLLEDPPSA